MISALFVLSFTAAADDLYDPAPPPDSAFVRFVNIGASSTFAKIGKREVGAVGKSKAGKYYLAKKGARTLALGDATLELDVASGHYYTVTQRNDTLVVIEDTANDNLAKALLSVYNLTDRAAVDLKTADGKAAIVAGAAPFTTDSRPVNAITVDLAIFEGTEALATFPGVTLDQGAAYSAFLLPGSEGPVGLWVQSVTDTTK